MEQPRKRVFFFEKRMPIMGNFGGENKIYGWAVKFKFQLCHLPRDLKLLEYLFLGL